MRKEEGGRRKHIGRWSGKGRRQVVREEEEVGGRRIGRRRYERAKRSEQRGQEEGGGSRKEGGSRSKGGRRER